MTWLQRQLVLAPRQRGFHLVTSDVQNALPELATIRVGVLHVFIQHTSASITINENADSDVRRDLESSLNALAPEDFPYVHTLEGPDDMPSHIRMVLTRSSESIPIADGKLQLGTWQGLFVYEHRHGPMQRRLSVSVIGESG